MLTLGLCLACGLPSARADEASDRELERLEQALASYPDDPDLTWATAMALERNGHPDRAAELLTIYLERWPDRRPDAAFQLGRLRHEAGDDEGALRALARAAEEDADPGPAHFYRGLALRALGRTKEARDAFDVASWHEPELRAQALLLSGLDSLDADEPDEGRARLLEAARLDQTGEIARLAREALAGQQAGSGDRKPRRLNLFASAGFESDSNVTLESDQLPSATSNENDGRWTIGAGLRVRAIQREDVTLTLGYRFDQSFHRNLESFDTLSHAPFLTGTWRVHPRATLRVDALYADSVLDGERYSRTLTAQPSVLFEIGPRAGLLRVHGEVTRRGYLEDAVFSSLERSGTTLGAGVTHYVGVPWLDPRAFAAFGAAWDKTSTDASNDLLGFAGDYDRQSYSANARLYWPLPHDLTLDATTSLAREPYRNANLVHSLTDEGVGTTERRRRHDTLFESRLGLSWKLSSYVDAEVAWRYTRQISNVDVYEYDRHVFGLYLKTEL